MRPFEGIRVIDVTHVLAGPFAAYQLAVLGADVIKIDDPNDPDQSRSSGSDKELNRRQMGTGFLTQGSNKRAITLDLKTEHDREILKKLVATADVFVENYRPGAFAALGLGYEDLAKINPRLIYASFSAFGQEGPRGQQTAYDHVIQATSGIMAMTGTKEVNPVKFGSPAIDYATGMTGAFALSAALLAQVAGAEREEPILGGEHAVGGVRMLVAGGLRRRTGAEIARDVRACERQRHVVHRKIDALAALGPLALEQRARQRERAHRPGGVVDRRRADLHGVNVLGAGHRHDA